MSMVLVAFDEEEENSYQKYLYDQGLVCGVKSMSEDDNFYVDVGKCSPTPDYEVHVIYTFTSDYMVETINL